MEMFKSYYSLDECRTRDKVLSRLDILKIAGKIDYKIDNSDILEIEDIDLDDIEVEDLESFFDDNDVIPYMEREDDDEDDYDDFYDEDDYDY